jgi:hypothetical protein
VGPNDVLDMVVKKNILTPPPGFNHSFPSRDQSIQWPNKLSKISLAYVEIQYNLERRSIDQYTVSL